MSLSPIAQNLQLIQQSIETSCAAGRSPAEVSLVGVCKGQPIEKIREALTLGVNQLGDNYAQEFKRHRADIIEKQITWHFIGHLQRNKVKDLLATAANQSFLLHTLDRLSLATEIQRHAAAKNTPVDCLVQVLPEKLKHQEERSGCPEDQVLSFMQTLRDFTFIRVRGLMLLPPAALSPEEARPFFRGLKDLAGRLAQDRLVASADNISLNHLSMGMSQDYPIAIAEGATLIRVGTALFGQRN